MVLPNLARAMSRRLVEQATEAAIEGMFGNVKKVLRDDRQTLLPDHTEILGLSYIRARMQRTAAKPLPQLPLVGVMPTVALDVVDESDDDGSAPPLPAAGTAGAAAAALKTKPAPSKVKIGKKPAAKKAGKKATAKKSDSKTKESVPVGGRVKARAAAGAAASAAAVPVGHPVGELGS